MLQPISTLSVSKETIAELRENGFPYVQDIINNLDLCTKCTHIPNLEKFQKIPLTTSALGLLEEESLNDYVSSSSRALDIILNGGFRCETITELYGAPGSGKTQLCLQACVTVQLKEDQGGVNGRAIYIDTRNGLSVTRLEEIIKNVEKSNESLRAQRDEILKGITVVSARTAQDLYKVISSIKNYLRTNSRVSKINTIDEPTVLRNLVKIYHFLQIRLIALDSLSFPVQCCLRDPWCRTQVYFRIVNELQELSESHNIAIIIVNELTTQIDEKGDHCFNGAAGELSAHRIHRRIMLMRLIGGKFVAHAVKIVTMPQISVLFQITPDGIIADSD
ncbi:DNA repair protein RAD51 homolog 3 isoform X4 [Cephus cinctus]|uniref:DNA repair protein RAD51 homolog 3 n=1 Tax=Cephus cinctus TaxID=211228 RepID=A0AAJ7W7S9_CEPCN|nr:DNA repair protein RAD51 homolog 3 isoform X4 [Cephus cinctus]